MASALSSKSARLEAALRSARGPATIFFIISAIELFLLLGIFSKQESCLGLISRISTNFVGTAEEGSDSINGSTGGGSDQTSVTSRRQLDADLYRSRRCLECEDLLDESKEEVLKLKAEISMLRTAPLSGLKDPSAHRSFDGSLLQEAALRLAKVAEGMALEMDKAGKKVEEHSAGLVSRIEKKLVGIDSQLLSLAGHGEAVKRIALDTSAACTKTHTLLQSNSGANDEKLSPVREENALLVSRVKECEASKVDIKSALEAKLASSIAAHQATSAKYTEALKQAESGSLREEAKGYNCSATPEEIAKYLDYKPFQLCPNDWFFVQYLIYIRNCFALPRRKCYAQRPEKFIEPVPFPQSLWDQQGLRDTNVDWRLHKCQSFQCLNTRTEGDCRNCFNLSLERTRWTFSYRGSITMDKVVAMKKGSLRIGLDLGGGTGSFAAKMADYNVTIMTSAMNLETLRGANAGLPYFETISSRGLIPLFMPFQARQPFFDNTLDIVHAVNSIKYLSIPEFEDLFLEINRILRPGGLIWLEMFYVQDEKMPLYIRVLEGLKYNKFYWNLTPKPDIAEEWGKHTYLNCVLEKPLIV